MILEGLGLGLGLGGGGFLFFLSLPFCRNSHMYNYHGLHEVAIRQSLSGVIRRILSNHI